MIQLNKISFHSSSGEPLLRQVSCRFPKNKMSMILGPNGSGKTLVLKTMAGLLEANQGDVFIGERNSRDLSPNERANLVAWLPSQCEVPFQFNVMDIILMGRFPIHKGLITKSDRGACVQILKSLDLTAFATRQYASLSQGEKARVQLARVLAAETPVVLLDEICANLDIKIKIDILNFLKNQSAFGKTVILSHHDLHSVAGFADYIVMIKEGRILNSGPCPAVFTAKGLEQAFGIYPKKWENAPNGQVSLLF